MSPDPLTFIFQVTVTILFWEIWARHWLLDPD